MNHNISVKRTKRTLIGLLASLLLTAGTLFYSYDMEPKTLTVTRHHITSSTIPHGFDGKTILQFSDVHLGKNYTHDQLRTLVNCINQEQPDIVVFTGDLIDNFNQYGSHRKGAQPILAQIQAPLGKYAVFGNHDRGGGGSRLYKQYMEGAGFTVLVNEARKITADDGESITISGLDDFLLGNPDIPQALQPLQMEDFNLLLVHEPDIADLIMSYPVDLQLSGHSHGGQVQIPWFGTIYTPPLAKKYVEGWYAIDGVTEQNKPLRLYVNRGIGTTELPFRFLSAPELTVIQLQHRKS